MNSNDDKLTFEEKELSILRNAVDEITSKQGKKTMNSPEVRDIIEIVEDFLRSTKRICYGGTAINNLLPKNDQFYNKEIELPDYDFYSPDPLNDAKNLADIYYDKGYTEVEAKSGMHAGTFKVFVNYIPVADITYLPKDLYDRIMKDSSQVNGISSVICSRKPVASQEKIPEKTRENSLGSTQLRSSANSGCPVFAI